MVQNVKSMVETRCSKIRKVVGFHCLKEPLKYKSSLIHCIGLNRINQLGVVVARLLYYFWQQH